MLTKKEIVVPGTVVVDMGRIEDWPITQLRYTCKKNRVKGYTKMSKDQLVDAVKDILKKFDEKRETHG